MDDLLKLQRTIALNQLAVVRPIVPQATLVAPQIMQATRRLAVLSSLEVAASLRSLGAAAAVTKLAIDQTAGLRALASFSNSVAAINIRTLGALADFDLDDVDDDEAVDELLDHDDELRELLARVERLPLEVVRDVLRDPTVMYNLSGREFEQFIAELLARRGYRDVVLTPRSNDKGIDILATLDVNGVPLAFIFECKKHRRDRKIKPMLIRALAGAALLNEKNVDRAVLVTTATFTKESRLLIAQHALLDGKDYCDLEAMIRRGPPRKR